jgi:hypothetical protein
MKIGLLNLEKCVPPATQIWPESLLYTDPRLVRSQTKETGRNMTTSGDNSGSSNIVLGNADQNAIKSLRERAANWARDNQCVVGVAEVALGAALLAWGVQSGAIEVGAQIVGSVLSPFPDGGTIGAVAGGGMGATAAAYIGSIGLAGMGSAIAVPALVLIGAGTTVFASFGYTVGDLAEKFLHPTFADQLGSGSAALVGVALMVDGCRKLIKDETVLRLASELTDSAIRLTQLSADVVAKSMDDLRAIAKAMATIPEDTVDATGSAVTGLAAGAAGTAAGAAIAASTVTVLGSSTLGSAALTLGLVSAPLWPVIVGGSAGLAVGYGVWKAAKHFMRKPK